GVRGRVPLRVVRMLPETRQVLLLDRNRGTHVVAEVGQEVDGYLVDDIAGDEVTLVSPNGTDVILAAPNPSWRRAPQRRPAPHREPQPIDPYAAPGSPDALDSEVGPVRGASASSAVADEPYEPGAGGVRVASAAT